MTAGRTRRLTPAEVLDALRDLAATLGETDRGEAADAVGPQTPLEGPGGAGFDAASVEDYFNMPAPLPDEWWDRVREFGTVGGLCLALAQFVEVPAVQPGDVPGMPPDEAGFFLYVRDRLAAAGADAEDLTPDAPLAGYLWQWPDVFRWELPPVAPGRVPPLVVTNRHLGRRVVNGLIAVAVMLLAGAMRNAFPLMAAVLFGVGLKGLAVNAVLAAVAARRGNWEVEFGGLTDFRSLARAMAGKHPDAAAA